MGECGCGNTNPDYRFDGPDGIIYTVQFYTGCTNGCETPAGIILSRYYPEDTGWAAHPEYTQTEAQKIQDEFDKGEPENRADGED
jgi:hypothetical protein